MAAALAGPAFASVPEGFHLQLGTPLQGHRHAANSAGIDSRAGGDLTGWEAWSWVPVELRQE